MYVENCIEKNYQHLSDTDSHPFQTTLCEMHALQVPWRDVQRICTVAIGACGRAARGQHSRVPRVGVISVDATYTPNSVGSI